MKKARLLAVGLTASLAVSIIGTASAADIKAKIYWQALYVEGKYTVCANEQDQLVPELQYNGTTYIPIRTAGEWMGKQVEWDGNTKTVILKGQAEKRIRTSDEYFERGYDVSSTAFSHGEDVQADLSSNISVMIDGKKQTFQNAKGETVYPLVYKGSTYLPLRNIGELSNMDVFWKNTVMADPYPSQQKIYLRSKLTDTQYNTCKTYLNQLISAYNKIGEDYTQFKKSTTKDNATKYAESLVTQLTNMKNAKAPELEFLSTGKEHLAELVDADLDYAQKSLDMLNSGSDVSSAIEAMPAKFQKNHAQMHIFISDMTTMFDPSLEKGAYDLIP